MFSSALKSFSSNIASNYTLAPQPNSISGPWRIFDAKRKQTGKAASVFVFEKKNLEAPGGGLGGRSSASSVKRAYEEVLERLKREASSLARLRHPSILELAEPVEETRSGGLMFATEAVTCSLAGLLQEKDEQERAGGRASRYVVEDSDGTRRRRELEIDELEIQKGLLQLAKGLEFLHESAGLVHANLTPDAIMVNAKGDWKISGLAFCGPHESSTAATSLPPISLHEVLNHDPRLPRSVQLNVDYTSPDFVLDNTLAASADMFSLGLLIVSLYNHPHTSPLSTGGSLSSYKRIFSSSSTTPTRNNNFLVPSSHPLPPKLASELLPRLITRRPAQRLSAKEFQEASYFDNILVSTVRFLDALPGKTPNEKMQFMRGLPRIMPQFPKSVLEKKVLPALLEEMKDKDLLAPIMTNIFAMVKTMPTGKRTFTERVVPRLREIFLTSSSSEKDTAKEAGLMILLENMQTVGEVCSGKEFREDILPIVMMSAESPTHALEDAALSTLPFVLPLLDFSTIKNELFPVIANLFTKTSSLSIKIRGLEAFCTLCGGAPASEAASDDDLNGIGVPDKKQSTTSSSAILDRYTVQEKLVPLLKGIKTKEPGVMMAALKVFRQVGEVADIDFLAMDVLPILWSMSLGPLLNLQQFQAFMSLIKNLSGKIETEHTRKLRDLSNNGGNSASARSNAAGRHVAGSSEAHNGLTNGDDADFETLVSGRKQNQNGDLMNDWGVNRGAPARSNDAPTFSWQTPASTLQPSTSINRAVTPDLASFAALTPSSQFSRPLQPGRTNSSTPSMPPTGTAQATAGLTGGASIDWSAAARSSPSPWSSQAPTQPSSLNGLGSAPRSAFSIPPPPTSPPSVGQAPSSYNFPTLGSSTTARPQNNSTSSGQKSGLDKYESLL
ncbi:kinase domain-containing ppk32-like [Lecanosticta acicola]|uniref:Kinase domain-containing ppk32-like n=1 Tax=Lecanosticta acicola TaxID=111012 RepID=A0AAI9ED12_9PEZI|nr:kinase domain-containing ppk32-like [Lecanosticta acicola]